MKKDFDYAFKLADGTEVKVFRIPDYYRLSFTFRSGKKEEFHWPESLTPPKIHDIGKMEHYEWEGVNILWHNYLNK